MAKKAKNTGRCSKISLHKKFKLNLEQNVSEQTCLEKTFGLQKCSFEKSTIEYWNILFRSK